MAGNVISKILPLYYNEITEGKLINKGKAEAKRFGMSFGTFMKYLLRDSKLITSNKMSQFAIEHERILTARREKAKAKAKAVKKKEARERKRAAKELKKK